MKKENSGEKKYIAQLTGRGVAGVVGIFFFISLWMFVLGILVGRGTAPVQFDINKLQKELTALRKTVIEKEQKEILDDTNALTSSSLEFYETVKETKKKEKHPARESEIHIKKRRVPEKNFAIKRKPVEPRPVIKTRVTKQKQAAAATKKPETRGKLTIQVAALKNKNDASQMVRQLKRKGYPAYLTEGKNADNKTFYRVRVGHYKKTSDARSTMDKLKQDKIDGFFVNR